MSKRTPKEVWEAIRRQAEQDEIDRFLAKTPEEVDAGLRAAGFDPVAVGREGAALAARLAGNRDRLAWQVEAAEALAREQASFDARPKVSTALSHAELLERLAVARKDPRLAQPVQVMFRNRKPEEASDDELRALLEEIEALAEKGK
ncbi:MAG TPA: hypothetical protein VGI39_04445 [Polyangiaceae bacterium]|jgi:hypothetical protein